MMTKGIVTMKSIQTKRQKVKNLKVNNLPSRNPLKPRNLQTTLLVRDGLPIHRINPLRPRAPLNPPTRLPLVLLRPHNTHVHLRHIHHL
jgi:hypothetical protein